MKQTIRKAFVLCICLCLSLSVLSVDAFADTQIDKVLATTSTTPVALMEVNHITSATSTPGCYIGAYGWYDLSGNALQGKFSTDTCKVEIRVDAYEGYYFGEGVVAYLNNDSVSATRDASGKSLYIVREYAPAVWQPTIIKNPGGETVKPGEWASFVATATYVSKYEWKFMSPQGNRYTVDETKAKFPGMSTSDNGTEKFNVYGIPVEMDGWKVFCVFSGPGGSVDSSGAKITVEGALAATPTPAPTPSPTPTPEPTATPEPVHEHEFSNIWAGDTDSHWRQCQCGELTDKGAHQMLWIQLKEASRKEPGQEEGKCGICGYTQVREVEYKGVIEGGFNTTMLRYLLIGLGALVMIVLISAIIISARNRRRRRRRRRRRY